MVGSHRGHGGFLPAADALAGGEWRAEQALRLELWAGQENNDWTSSFGSPGQ